MCVPDLMWIFLDLTRLMLGIPSYFWTFIGPAARISHVKQTTWVGWIIIDPMTDPWGCFLKFIPTNLPGKKSSIHVG